MMIRSAGMSHYYRSFIYGKALWCEAANSAPVTRSKVAPLMDLIDQSTRLFRVICLHSKLLPLLPSMRSRPTPRPFVPERRHPLRVNCSGVTSPAASGCLRFLRRSTSVTPTISLYGGLRHFLYLNG